MTPLEQVKILAAGMRQIGEVAAEPGEAGAMAALEEAQRIADQTLKDAGLERRMKVAKLRDIR